MRRIFGAMIFGAGYVIAIGIFGNDPKWIPILGGIISCAVYILVDYNVIQPMKRKSKRDQRNRKLDALSDYDAQSGDLSGDAGMKVEATTGIQAKEIRGSATDDTNQHK